MLNIRKFFQALGITPVASSNIDTKGEMEVDNASGALVYHNGTSASHVVTETHAATLTNKTVDVSANTFTNIADTNIKSGAAIDAAKIADGSVSNTEFEALDGISGNIQSQINSVTGSAVTSLTGDVTGTGPGATAATIAAGAVTNAKIANAAGIAVNKLAAQTASSAVATDASGFLTPSATSSTELGYVAGVTSAIQTQINNKQPLDSTLTALAAYNTNGVIVQTAVDTFAGRTITGTANTIAVTNGNGVAGNPTITIADNPVLPGTAAVQLPVGTTAQRPGSPVAGDIRYNSDNAQFEGYTTAWGAIAGSGGAINYISASDGTTTTGWATYANTAGTAPVTGTGGSPTVTFVSSTSSPLFGTASFLFTKGSSNLQGQGFSYAFSIDPGIESSATPCTIKGFYNVSSGTYASGDMTIWIYDVTNSQLIQPSGSSILNNIGAAAFQCEFQPNTNSSSYRLIFHVSSTSASAYTLQFDNIAVSPNTYNPGASITPIPSYVPTVTGMGTVTGMAVDMFREGAYLVGSATWVTGTAAATLASFSLPPGLAIDPARVTQTTTTAQNSPLYGQWQASSSAEFGGIVVAISTNATLLYFSAAFGASQMVPQNGSSIVGSGVLCSINFRIPILGWSVNQVLSSDTATRVISAIVTNSSNLTASTSAMPFNTIIKDSSGSYSTSTGNYVAPVPGFYTVTAASAFLTGAGSFALGIKQNSSTPIYIYTFSGATSEGGGSTQFYCNAGDTLAVVTSGTGSSLAAGCVVSFTRQSGPAQIAASEKVYCQYTGNAGTVLTANVTNIDFTTKVVDSHGAWNGTTFTAPRPGWFNLVGEIGLTTQASRAFYLWINGVQKFVLNDGNSGSSPHISGGAYLNAGDVVNVRSDSAGTLTNSTTIHWIAITSQG